MSFYIITTAAAVTATAIATADAWFGRSWSDFDEINSAVEKREMLRQEKLWQDTDNIRTELEQRGIIIHDGEYTNGGLIFWRKE